MSDPVFVAFASQKGGSGKSTLTALTASYLHYVEGVDVLVVDCDSRQYTQKDYRDHDIVVINETPALKKTFMNFYKRFDKQPYEILYSTPATAIEQAEEYMKDYPMPKVVFFDITGTINDMDLVNLLARMHYLFIPITTDTGDMKSSIRFANKVMSEMIAPGDSSIKEIKLVWNRIPSRKKSKLCELIDNYLEELQLSSLNTVLSNSARFSKDDGGMAARPTIFRSTMMPPDKQLLKDSDLPELVREIREIINV